MNIGIIGLGSMGRPMAQHLARAGDVVYGFDINGAVFDLIDGNRIRRAESPRAIAEQCEAIVSIVWDDVALRSIVDGPDGVLGAEMFRGTLVDLSTTSVALARAIGVAFDARGAHFVDGAVVGGGVQAAKAARSPIVIGGSPAACSAIEPLLERLGTCRYVGPQGAGKVVKVVNNFLVGVTTVANAELLSLGVAAGLDLAQLVGLVGKGAAASYPLRYMESHVQSGTYGDGLIGHRLMAKDLSLACELAREVGSPAILPALGRQAYIAFECAAGPDAPFPAAYDAYRALNGNALAPRLLKGEAR